MLTNQGMEARHAIQPLDDSAPREELAVRIDHAHVVVALGPVNTYEDHRTSLLVIDRAGGTQQHANGSVLIGTPSHQPFRLPRQPGGGTIYRWNLALSNGEVLTHRRLGPSLA